MCKLPSTFGLLTVFGSLLGACSGDAPIGRGAGLTGVDGGAGTGGAAGVGGGGAGAASAGNAGASLGDAGATPSGDANDASDARDAGDAGEPACRWDGVTQRVSLNCIGDDYEYLGPGCRFNWYQCGTGGPPELHLDDQWVLSCRAQGSSMVCDCLDKGRSVGTISAPSDICPVRPPGAINGDAAIYIRFLELAPSCFFCFVPT